MLVVISIVANAFIIWFIISWISKGFKNSLKPFLLAIGTSLIPIIGQIFGTHKTKTSVVSVFFFVGIFIIFFGIYSVFLWNKSENIREDMWGTAKIFIVGILAVLIPFMAAGFSFSGSSSSDKDPLDKDPNSWTQEDKEYINDKYGPVWK